MRDVNNLNKLSNSDRSNTLRGESINFRLINDTRKFEISLFWQRAIFFGGFISIIFVGYYTIKDVLLRFLLSVFGILCSFFWTLANKGSKFWQENWEGHIENNDVLRKKEIFTTTFRKKKKGILGAKQFSPSKISIALSIYITLLWLFLMIYSFVSLNGMLNKLMGIFLIIFTFTFAFLVSNESHTLSKKWKDVLPKKEWQKKVEEK